MAFEQLVPKRKIVTYMTRTSCLYLTPSYSAVKADSDKYQTFCQQERNYKTIYHFKLTILNSVARTLKKLRTSNGDYWIK